MVENLTYEAIEKLYVQLYAAVPVDDIVRQEEEESHLPSFRSIELLCSVFLIHMNAYEPSQRPFSDTPHLGAQYSGPFDMLVRIEIFPPC